MAEVVGLLWRDDLPQLLLYLQGVLAAVGDAQPSGDADAVGVADVALLAVDVAQNQVGRRAASASPPYCRGPFRRTAPAAAGRRPRCPAPWPARSRRTGRSGLPRPHRHQRTPPAWDSAGTAPALPDLPGHRYTGLPAARKTAAHSPCHNPTNRLHRGTAPSVPR